MVLIVQIKLISYQEIYKEAYMYFAICSFPLWTLPVHIHLEESIAVLFLSDENQRCRRQSWKLEQDAFLDGQTAE